MKKFLAVLLFLGVLAAPAMAAPRDDDPRGPGGVAGRVLLLIKKIVRGVVPLDDPIGPVPPKP